MASEFTYQTIRANFLWMFLSVTQITLIHRYQNPPIYLSKSLLCLQLELPLNLTQVNSQCVVLMNKILRYELKLVALSIGMKFQRMVSLTKIIFVMDITSIIITYCSDYACYTLPLKRVGS